MRPRNAFIVGAGFSHYAGLPLQAEFTSALLDLGQSGRRFAQPLVDRLRKFVHDVFDHNAKAGADFWPDLEDVFTNIDLAANAGHHLGSRYSAADLRTTRRLLLSAAMLTLDQRYRAAERSGDREWGKLKDFVGRIDPASSSFISINWDTVIERTCAKVLNTDAFDYRCGAAPAEFPGDGNVAAVKRDRGAPGPALRVVKVHGSVNWLYCDNCRRLYWFDPRDATRVALQILTKAEGRRFAPSRIGECARWRCPSCPEVPLTTRIATFSYLKALDFPMFERSWLAAEGILMRAEKWVFIGYSLPAADYEFKHLLKRVQLSRANAPKFTVISGGPDAERTYRNYQRFLGRGIKKGSHFFDGGLTGEAIEAATSG